MARTPRSQPASTRIRCGECNEQMHDSWSGDVVHCVGSSTAYHARTIETPHHGHALYPACWRCRRSLGCDRCAGIAVEVLCMSCAAWGTPAALAAHGPCLNDPGQIAKRRGKRAPQVNEYPLDFQAAYRAAEPLQQTTPAQARAMVRGLFDRVAVPEE